MTASNRRFDPPEPLYGPGAKRHRSATADRSGADGRGFDHDDTDDELPPRSRTGTWLMLALAATVIAGLVTALVITGGVRVEPQAGERAPTVVDDATPESTDELFDVPTSTNSSMVVKPNDTVPITVDAVFENGFTLTPPSLGDWRELKSQNRPDQFAARKDGMQIIVWQISMFDSGQSDEALTIAQLNRIEDECAGAASGISDPEPYTLTGKDGTKLELLRVRVKDCAGTELWMLTRAMPKSGTRLYIIVAGSNVENSRELMDKLGEVSFTSP